MKTRWFSPVLAGSMLFSGYALPQQTTSAALSPLQASLSAMVGQATIQDVTLTGTAELIAGSSDQTVPVTLRSLSGGSSRIDLSLAAGVMSDIRLIGVSSSSVPSGTWTNGNGTQHPISQHNMMTDSGWFFPALVAARAIANPALTTVFVAQEGTLLHYQTYLPNSASSPNPAPTIQHLTQMDIYLNATTLLPAQLTFNVHPDNNASVDIPVVVQFQNYQTVNGVTLPFQVQKFVNNSLVLNIQIQSAVFNSGLTASTLSAQ